MLISAAPPDQRGLRGVVRALVGVGERLAPFLPLGLFLISMILTTAFFLPHLSEIGQWDEASYIYRGWLMLHGEGLHPFATSPLISALYALSALPFEDSPYWFVHAASVGRFLLISMLWLCTYLISRRLTPVAYPSILVGLLFIHPFTTGLTQYPSDPLLAALGGLGFWQLLAFHQDRGLRSVWAGSGFLGLAALARNDGLILFAVFLAVTVALTIRTRNRWRALLACVLPFGLLVGGYILAYGALTGDFHVGVMERTYDSFEAGQEVVVRPSGEINMTIEAHQQAREAFGTPEENGYSVLRAIARNPQAYLERLIRALEILPSTLWAAYGGRRYAALILLLALRGILALVRARKVGLLVLFLLWPAHLLTSLVTTLFRINYLLFTFYIPFGLAAVGLTALLRNLGDRRERVFWSLAMAAYALLGLAIGSKPMIFAGGAFIAVYWGSYILQHWPSGLRELHVPAALAGFFLAGILLRAGFPGVRIRHLGSEAAEQAMLAMMDNLDRGSVVAAGSPAVVWAADMTYLGLASNDVPYRRPPPAFLEWMVSQHTAAIYVDNTLVDQNPAIWDRIRPLIGGPIITLYEGNGGEVRVLLVERAREAGGSSTE